MKRRVPQSTRQELPSHEQDLSSLDRKGIKSRKNPQSQRNLSLWISFYTLGLAVFIYVTRIGYSAKSTRGMPRSYTPVERDDITLADWEWPHIHIVNTRFMQEQGNLTALGRSRLALFKIFCLPTMQHQSSQQFLWVIKTDPDLDPLILQELVTDLQEYPNFFLVASNVNYHINEQFPGAWRGGAEIQDLARSKIYTGNQTLLEMAMALQDQLPVLETRLDADDGLHVQFLEQVQNDALDRFVDNNDGTSDEITTPKWLYWCARRHMEWHWHERTCGEKDTMCQLNNKYGSLTGVAHSELCIASGITVGFPVGVEEHQVPVHPHHLLAHLIRSAPPGEGCGYKKSADCLIFVHTFIFEVIRSRTPTSAGMLDIELAGNDNSIKSTWATYAYWNMLHESFHIQRESLFWMHQYLSDHLIEIARDNLLGQCKTGHSCKEEAKQGLENLIASRHNATLTIAATESHESSFVPIVVSSEQ